LLVSLMKYFQGMNKSMIGFIRDIRLRYVEQGHIYTDTILAASASQCLVYGMYNLCALDNSSGSKNWGPFLGSKYITILDKMSVFALICCQHLNSCAAGMTNAQSFHSIMSHCRIWPGCIPWKHHASNTTTYVTGYTNI
jgi:hypothetical protein